MLKKRIGLGLVVLAVAVLAVPVVASAMAGFTDVDAGNVHKADIDWLADAGVTLGCNPPANDKFCPKNAVTREQMASFLRRLANNQVVDAGQLGGADPSAYDTYVVSGHSDDLADVDGAASELFALDVDVIVDGIIAVTGTSQVMSVGDPWNDMAIWLELNNAACDRTAAIGIPAIASVAATEPAHAIATVIGSSVAPAGGHTISVCAEELTAGDVVAGPTNLIVTVSPSDVGTVGDPITDASFDSGR